MSEVKEIVVKEILQHIGEGLIRIGIGFLILGLLTAIGFLFATFHWLPFALGLLAAAYLLGMVVRLIYKSRDIV